MLNLGSITIAERIIANFQQAGITKIVMVTGFNAITLERHLASHNIVFLRNEHYETTQMFDSARIGLAYLKDKVDQVLFTPVDVPLFTAATVEKILASNAPLVAPVCNGRIGHPILIHSCCIDAILADQGDQGLRGAMERCGTEMLYLPVEDPGILHDADTPEDYRTLLKLHNASLVRPDVRVALAKEKPFFDEQMAVLLTLIDETHSVRDACIRMQISYSTGWNRIRNLESQLSAQLITRSQGGQNGSRSEITEYGHRFLQAYDSFQSQVRSCTANLFEECFADVFPS